MSTKISGNSGVDKVQPLSIELEDLKWVPPFTKEFVSPEQTIVLGGLLTLTHGLGVAPNLVNAGVVCKAAEGGYSVGDVVPSTLQLAYTDAGAIVADTATLTDTQILVRIQNVAGVYRVPNKSTGAPFNITPANWRLIVRAWA